MVAVDTDVIVRFLVRDDEQQVALVYQHLSRAKAERERLFVPLAVVLETIWVLRSAYGSSRVEILEAIQDMRQMQVFAFERDEAIERMLNEGRGNRADLADLLIACSARTAGCDSGITFDKGAARLPFFSLSR